MKEEIFLEVKESMGGSHAKVAPKNTEEDQTAQQPLSKPKSSAKTSGPIVPATEKYDEADKPASPSDSDAKVQTVTNSKVQNALTVGTKVAAIAGSFVMDPYVLNKLQDAIPIVAKFGEMTLNSITDESYNDATPLISSKTGGKCTICGSIFGVGSFIL